MFIVVLIFQLTRFCQDIAGIDKALRLIQSCSQIVAAYSLTPAAAAPWLVVKTQFALTRRYLRFLNFVDYFRYAYTCITKSNGPISVLEFGKWSCLGLYVLLESSTIMDAMHIWSPPWTKPVYDEAMRFWFYAISIALILRVLDLVEVYNIPPTPTPTVKISIPAEEVVPKGEEKKFVEKVHLEVESEEELEKKAANGKASTTKKAKEVKEGKKEIVDLVLRDRRRKAWKDFIVDLLTLFQPGTATGWLPLGEAVMGMVMVVGTILTSTDIWARVQTV